MWSRPSPSVFVYILVWDAESGLVWDVCMCVCKQLVQFLSGLFAADGSCQYSWTVVQPSTTEWKQNWLHTHCMWTLLIGIPIQFNVTCINMLIYTWSRASCKFIRELWVLLTKWTEWLGLSQSHLLLQPQCTNWSIQAKNALSIIESGLTFAVRSDVSTTARRYNQQTIFLKYCMIFQAHLRS